MLEPRRVAVASFKANVVLAAVTILARPVGAQTYELISNGTFDATIAGWELPTVADTTVSWQADGVPSGSLRIESALDAPAGTPIFVRSPCIPIQSGADYFRSADVRAESTPPGAGACNFDIFAYGDSECSEPHIGNTFSDAGPDGVWTPIVSGPHPLSPPAVRIVLWMRRFPSDVSACSFDNVSFLGPPPPSALEIPVLDRASLLALTLAIASAALVALRLRKPSAR